MIGKLAVDDHRELFRTRLEDLINPNHELALLAKKIDWQYIEDLFKDFYSDKPSRRAVPVRLMAGCLLLKYLYNLSDERLPEYWVRDVYFQYFCGGIFFAHEFPCDPSDFVHFRKRIGESGIEKIFSYSVKLHGAEVPVQAKFVLSDTTFRKTLPPFPLMPSCARK